MLKELAHKECKKTTRDVERNKKKKRGEREASILCPSVRHRR